MQYLFKEELILSLRYISCCPDIFSLSSSDFLFFVHTVNNKARDNATHKWHTKGENYLHRTQRIGSGDNVGGCSSVSTAKFSTALRPGFLVDPPPC